MRKKRHKTRLQSHIDECGRVFLPDWRMRQIRWEESVARAKARREGLVDVVVSHGDCHCGSVGCLAVPSVREKKRQPG
jgi:hypothetical protein